MTAITINLIGRPLVAEDCLPPQFREGLQLRKVTLKLDKSTAIYDPTKALITFSPKAVDLI